MSGRNYFSGTGCPVVLYFLDRHHGGSNYFTLWLDRPLREGERFEWFFIRPRQDAQGYYVDEVSHEYRNGRQVVSSFLRGGWYSGYRKMLFEKARLLRLLDGDELYGLKAYELDQLLVHRVEKDRPGFPESLAYLNRKKY